MRGPPMRGKSSAIRWARASLSVLPHSGPNFLRMKSGRLLMGGPPTSEKNLAEHARDQAEFLGTELKPRLEAAVAGEAHVFFVDAAHFVFGTFLCCLWSFARIFVRAAPGRPRFNVLGAWDAVARRLIAVTNT